MISATSSPDSGGAWDDEPNATIPRALRSVSAPARLPVVVPVLTPEPSDPLPPPALPAPAPVPASALTPAPSPTTDCPPSPPIVVDTPRAPKVTRPIDPADLEQGPSVAPELWVREPEAEVWESTRTLIAGKRPIARPRGQPLPRPQRFFAPAPWRSAVVLGLVVLLVGVLAIGALQAAHLSTQLLGAPHLPPTPHLTPSAPLHGTPGLTH